MSIIAFKKVKSVPGPGANIVIILSYKRVKDSKHSHKQVHATTWRAHLPFFARPIILTVEKPEPAVPQRPTFMLPGSQSAAECSTPAMSGSRVPRIPSSSS